MKTLLLFRHADAASRRAHATDHARPLTPRGRDDALQMGHFLAATGQQPDHAVASTATRARQTLEQARAGGRWAADDRGAVPTEAALYDASAADVLGVVHAAPGPASRLLLVGHNPTFTDVAVRLMGGGNVKMATGTIARIDVPVDAWADVRFNRGRLRWLLSPNHLPR